MKQSDDLGKFDALIGASASSSDIATVPATQATAGDGTASIALGFPPETFIARAAGGVPPRGQDMNGFLNRLSRAVQVLQAGYLGPYDATFAAAIGGYPQGAIVSGTVAGTFWVSTADANTTVPGATGAAWQSLFANYTATSDADLRYVRASGAGDLQGGHDIYFGYNGSRVVSVVDSTEFGNVAFSNQFQSASSKVYYAASTAQRSITLEHNAPVPGTYIVQAGVNVGAPPGDTQPYMAALEVFYNGASSPIDSDSTPLSMSHALTISAVAGENTISCVYQPASTSGTWYPIGLSLSYLFVPS
ncbi:hypothetical protein K2X14_11705 [Acetobacter sp. TBRC 12305]|uniref:Tail fiber protein n=1 Tax=Acetobacter garciniae TaxID=2817435 RepID=A0A939HQ03_9PROT|nr:hypothetical protein [Acetobacter garciniae]MBO1325324.1 hypothetical protein [Acetobacter garciniae]MBX0345504.1 hypothetical protein [Acetobacter garciniae]